MPSYLSPGVYVEEVSSGSKPIAGVGTSTGAFVGKALKGNFNQPTFIANWTQFVETFGGFSPNSHLAYSVYSFFAEGGTACYVIRVEEKNGVLASASLNAEEKDGIATVKASTTGVWGNDLKVVVEDASNGNSKNFKLVVKKSDKILDVFDNTSLSQKDLNKINRSSFINLITSLSDNDRPQNSDFQDVGAEVVYGSLKITPKKVNYFTVSVKEGEGAKFDLTITVDGKNFLEWKNNGKKAMETAVNKSNVFSATQGVSTSGPKAANDLKFDENGKMSIVDSDNKEVLSLSLVDDLQNKLQFQVADATDEDAKKFNLSFRFKDTSENLASLENVSLDNFPESKVAQLTLSESSDAMPVLKRSEYQLTAGADATVDYIGGVDGDGNKTGMFAFEEIDDINIMAIPDCQGDPSTIKRAYTYCEETRGGNCFFIGDSAKSVKSPMQMKDWRLTNGFNTSYMALYYPWIYMSDPLITGETKLVPPSGMVMGVYAYTDSKRGVHKAPAGITEGRLKTAVGIERKVIKSEHDLLHPVDVDVIRDFPGAGICIWGARTVSADKEWQYINVRRLFIYLRESIYRGTQWVVFEPNDAILWGKINRNITAFLMGVWRSGALFGSTPDEAFFVKVDAENNPPSERNKGNLNIDIAVAPVKPAEFVIFRISQKIETA